MQHRPQTGAAPGRLTWQEGLEVGVFLPGRWRLEGQVSFLPGRYSSADPPAAESAPCRAWVSRGGVQFYVCISQEGGSLRVR